jgi:hypothetical protein
VLRGTRPRCDVHGARPPAVGAIRRREGPRCKGKGVAGHPGAAAGHEEWGRRRGRGSVRVCGGGGGRRCGLHVRDVWAHQPAVGRDTAAAGCAAGE